MRIQDLETFVVGNPPPGFGGRYFLFVKLTADDGTVGYGEVYAASFGPKALVAMIEDVFARHLQDHSPFETERFFRACHGSGFSQRPDPSMMGVASGLEMACWDIVGKALDRPVRELIGGTVHRRLRGYTYLYPGPAEDPATFYADPDASAARAAELVAEGFTALKFDPAGPYTQFGPHQPDMAILDRSEAFCAKVRAAVGDKADLLFGTHGQFTPSGAKRLARRLEPYDPLWFEEPISPEMPEHMGAVAAATRIPVATGERLTTKWEFARVLRSGAANILQMNLGRVGGILEAKKIAGMAEAYAAQIAPHLYCGPIVGAANIQIAAASPNFLILEGIGKWDGFHADILKTPIRWEDGHVIPPDAPGLGVELNEDVARAHPYEGERLHLEMQPQPFDPARDGLFAGG
ncbi:mandelate racemase/muconate lactonizing enzyme family protein [Marivibrio halodurans]|uniref:Mandelate racemase/muconate lactonizing enzyme family protein n=1 Tax=Marivibrio halodurans TaxID=2039722 RepID=A0A8J7S866_9PROT|nr:mandelate racemase/muconate lactonizing enzyme family protein [Marivibrio halodurans]MBP5858639.1 mandelate racemase/muconate lactonizing enzyme family protein [Marivibrio halodurans]